VLLRSDDDSLAVALKTTWDSADDALEFATSVLVAMETGGLDAKSFHQGGTRDVLVAIGDHAAEVLAALRG